MAEMSETELIPNQFAYQILRKLSAGNLVRVRRGALGGCELSGDLDATSLYDLMEVMGGAGRPMHLHGAGIMYAAGRTSTGGAPSTVKWRSCSKSRTRRSARREPAQAADSEDPLPKK